MTVRNKQVTVVTIFLALIFLSIGVRLQTQSEPSSSMSPNYMHFGQMVRSAEDKLIHQFREQATAPHFTPKKDLHKNEQYSDIVSEIILNETQYKFVIINSTTILTVSETDYWYLTFNVVNLADKTKYSKVFYDFRVTTADLVMKLVDQNTVAVFINGNFLLLKIDDLTIKQKIVFSEPPKKQGQNAYGDIYYIETYLKNESGIIQNTMVLGYQGVIAQVLEFNYKTNLYEKVNEAYKPMGDYFLTGSNEGVSFWHYNKVPSTLRDNFKIYDKLQQRQNQRSNFVVSNSEDLVATTFESPSYFHNIRINSLNKTNFEMKELYTVGLPVRLMADGDKIRFTNDSKYLFANLRKQWQDYRCVGIVNIETARITYFDFDGENMTGPLCFDYGILDDIRFVIVCQSLTKDGKNQVSSYYQLRLYNLSNFKLLDTYSISAEATNLQIKTNPNFNLSFILQIFNQDNPIPKLQLFKIANNRISLSTMNLTNFKITTECLNYLVGVFANDTYHSFININNFQVVRKTAINDLDDRHTSYGGKDYFVQNNVLGICNNKYYFFQCEMYEFYDLSKIGRPDNSWQICNFFMESWTSFYFFLHKELYVFEMGEYQNIIKGFDLQKCPTKKLIPLQMQQTDQYIKRALYKRIEKTPTLAQQQQQSCNLAYFLYFGNEIHTMQDCPPYNPPTKTIIPTNSSYPVYQYVQDMKKSTNSKYLILMICTIDMSKSMYCRYQYDVRPIDNLERSVYRTGLVNCYVQRVENCFADVNDNDELIYLTQDALHLEKINLKGDDKEVIA